MNRKRIFDALNGKKIPITLIIFIITAATAYGALKQKVATNSDVIADLKQTPEQIARVEVEVNGINHNLKLMREEQRILQQDIKAILSAVR